MMDKYKSLLISFILITSVLYACGDEAPASKGPIVGDLSRGKEIFEQTGTLLTPNCDTCHTVEPDVVKAGSPAYLWAQTSAETIKKSTYTGQATTVEEYLRESILDPNLYIAEDYVGGIMYAKYSERLSEQDIADLIAYILSLE